MPRSGPGSDDPRGDGRAPERGGAWRAPDGSKVPRRDVPARSQGHGSAPRGPARASGGWRADEQLDAPGGWSDGKQWGQRAWGPSEGGASGAPWGGTAPRPDVAAEVAPARSWRGRLGLTRRQWRLAALSVWPGILRLVTITLVAGALVGVLFYSARAEPAPGPNFGSGGKLLGSNGAVVTPTISLYGANGPQFYEPPPPTATPRPKPTATATVAAPTFTVRPLAVQQKCASLGAAPAAFDVALDNSQGSTPVTWTITLQQAGWAQLSPASSGQVAAGQTATVTFSPTPVVCTGTQQSYTATLSWQTSTSAGGTGTGSGANSTTISDTVQQATMISPTMTPSPSPSATSSASHGP